MPRGLLAVIVATVAVTAASAAPAVQASVTNAAPSCTALTLDPIHTGQSQTGQLACTDADAGDTLSYAIDANPGHGSASVDASTGAVSYQPNPRFAGTDTFSVTVADGAGGQTTVVVSIDVHNQKPTCDAPSLGPVHTGTLVNGQLTCTDPDAGDSVTYSTDTAAANGSASADFFSGALSYASNPTFAGNDSFKVLASDGLGGDTVVTVPVTVTNAKPVCQGIDLGAVAPSQFTSGIPTCTDTDGDPVTLVIDTQPAHGTASAYFGNVSYTAGSGYTGADSFTFRATDGIEPSSAATATVAIVNHAPQCDDETLTIRTGKPVTDYLSCFDQDGNPTTLAIASAPAHGTAAIVTDEYGQESYRYTPAAGFTGQDSFTARASDGTDNSAPATVTVDVTQNHAPECSTFPVHTNVGTAKELSLFCTDQDRQDSADLTYALAAPNAAHGTTTNLDQSFGFASVTYTPNGGFSGIDSFGFTASDGDLTTSATQVMHVADTPLCDPVAPRQVRPAKFFFGSLSCTFPAGFPGSVTYSLVASPSKGTVSVSSFNGSYSYTAGSGASGADSFGISVTTTNAGSSPVVTQAVTVTPDANVAPVCVSTGSQVVYPERPRLLFTGCDDDDNDPLIYATNGAPAHGSSTISNGSLRYTADAGYTGPDSVPFTVTDGRGTPVAGTIDVDVEAAEVPSCSAIPAISLRPSQSKTFTLRCSNPQTDPQTYEVSRQGSKGTATIGAFGGGTYTANAGASGADSFDVRGVDAAGASVPVTVTANISPSANVAPTCSGNSFFTPYKVATATATTLPLGPTCQDADGDPLTYTRLSGPANGTVPTGPASSLAYTSNAGFLGGDSFTYKATDDHNTSSGVATFYVSVVESIKPTCVAQSALPIRPNQQKSFTLNCTDPNGGQITYEILSPTKGTLSPSGSSTSAVRSYTAGATAPDTDSFSYRATSPSGESTTYTQAFNISTSANSVPTCSPGSSAFPSQVSGGHANSLPSLCFDGDNDPLTYTPGTAPQHGSVSYTGGTISYTPAAGYTGPDSFSYSVSDGRPGGTAGPTTHYVQVSAPVPPTCSAPSAINVRTNSPGRSIPTFCSDSQLATVTYVIDSGPAHGTLTPAGSSTISSRSYKPNTGFTGDDSIVWHGESVNGSSAPQTQTIHVSDTGNTAPNCPVGTQSLSAKPGVTRSLPNLCVDYDGDALTASTVSAPSHGTLAFPAGSTPTYTANAAYTGDDAFTIGVSDGHGGNVSVPFDVDVSAANHAPVCYGTSITATSGQTFSFAGLVPCTDDDGDPVTLSVVTGPAHGTMGTGEGGARTYTPTAGYSGSDSFTYKGNDGFADSTVQTVTITVQPPAGPTNQPPTASISGPATALRGVTVTLTAVDADVDGTVTAREWDVDGDGFDDGTGTSVSRPFSTLGANTVQLRVTDDDGAKTTASKVVTVGNNAPTASISGAATTFRGTAVNLTGSDGDVDGTIASREWDFDGDGFDDGTGATASPSFTTLGAKTVRYRVTDNNGTPKIASKTVTVQNRAPSASLAGPATGAAGSAVALTATASDPDGAATIAKREWDTDGDGQFDDATGLSAAPVFTTAGAKTIRFRATDDGGLTAVATKVVTVTGPTTGGGGDGGGGAGGGGGGGGVTPPDTTAPQLTLTPATGQKLKAVAAKGLKLTLGSDEACALELVLKIDKKTAKQLKLGKKAMTVGTATATLANGTTDVTIKLTSKARKAFKKAKKIKLSAVATGTDPAGNAATLTKVVSLKK